MNSKEIESITKEFFENSTVLFSEELAGGIINQTILVQLSGNPPKYFILQKLNTSVFKKPNLLMRNAILISRHIAHNVKTAKKSFYTNFLFHPVKSGKYLHRCSNGGVWRLMDYVEHEAILNPLIDKYIAKEAGKILGRFHVLVSNMDIGSIQTTIPNFHQTDVYYSRFLDCSEVLSTRQENTKDIANKIIAFSYLIEQFVAIKNSNTLPIRIVHNDPKLANILFNKKREAHTMIDIDTCMPGYLNTDFGDAIRSITNVSSENEKNLDKVHFRIDLFEHFVKAYLSATQSIITKDEIKYFVFFSFLLTYEQLIRFYTDYLQKDTYYTISYPEHNLDRAKVQLKLLEEMMLQSDSMASIIESTQ